MLVTQPTSLLLFGDTATPRNHVRSAPRNHGPSLLAAPRNHGPSLLAAPRPTVLLSTARCCCRLLPAYFAEMCQTSPVSYIGVGFEDGSSYYLGWTGSTPGEGQLVAYITDERNTLGGLCSVRLQPLAADAHLSPSAASADAHPSLILLKHMICFSGIGGGGLKIHNFFLNNAGLHEQHWRLISRFTHAPVVQAVLTTALSSMILVNLMRGSGRGISSARSESGEPLSHTST